MTKRELLWGLLAMLLGVLVCVFVVLRRRKPPVLPPPVVLDASAPEPDAAEPPDDAAFDASPVDAYVADEEASVPPLSLDAEAPVDAAPKPDAGHHAPHPKLREADLEVRLVGEDDLCVDSPPRGPRLQLFLCHGKANQRWTFTEDLNGTSVISGEGGCWRVGPPTARGEAAVDCGACGPGSARFRHTDDRRLEEAHSGLCVTVHEPRKHAHLVLAACNPSHGGQTWSLSP